MHEYGIVHNETFEKLKKIVQENLKKIEKELIKIIENANPSFGQIFKAEDGGFNLEGFLVHGALLKGDSVHDIGAECLIRYFLKEYYEHEEEEYRVYIDDCFSSCRVPNMSYCQSDRHIADKIIECLQEYHKLSREIL